MQEKIFLAPVITDYRETMGIPFFTFFETGNPDWTFAAIFRFLSDRKPHPQVGT